MRMLFRLLTNSPLKVNFTNKFGPYSHKSKPEKILICDDEHGDVDTAEAVKKINASKLSCAGLKLVDFVQVSSNRAKDSNDQRTHLKKRKRSVPNPTIPAPVEHQKQTAELKVMTRRAKLSVMFVQKIVNCRILFDSINPCLCLIPTERTGT